MKARAPLAVALALLLLPLGFMDLRTYLTLTVAGLAMGMLIFLVAAGLTLIFGLMDVLNFAHGALFSWGAYAGFAVAALLNGRPMRCSWRPPSWSPWQSPSCSACSSSASS